MTCFSGSLHERSMTAYMQTLRYSSWSASLLISQHWISWILSLSVVPRNPWPEGVAVLTGQWWDWLETCDSRTSLKSAYKSARKRIAKWPSYCHYASWFLLRIVAKVFLLWCLLGHTCQSHSQGWWCARLKGAGASTDRASVCPWPCVPGLA